jgi:hypothetical protein
VPSKILLPRWKHDNRLAPDQFCMRDVPRLFSCAIVRHVNLFSNRFSCK